MKNKNDEKCTCYLKIIKNTFKYLLFILPLDLFAQNNFNQYPLDIIRIIKDDYVIEVGLAKPETKYKIIKGANYFWFNVDTILSTTEGFNGKLLHGKYTKTYKNGNLAEEGYFINGLKSGKWKMWFENGSLRERKNYKNGKENGEYVLFDTNGRIIRNGKYKKEKFIGKEFIYNIDGSITNNNIGSSKGTSILKRILRKKKINKN